MTTKRQLAAWIEQGLRRTDTTEDHTATIFRRGNRTAVNFECCALGLATIGKFNSPEHAYSTYMSTRRISDDYAKSFAIVLDIPLRLCERIADLHEKNKLPAVRIANRLLTARA